jgi:predicted alpha/beta-hydrolase family hydrolase
MRGHVILSHGLDSSPEATKVSALARVAESLGWTSERPDYSDIDARRDIAEVSARLERLVDCAQIAAKPLVLAGSSMGAFISALATLEVECVGLFLMAPPIALDGYPQSLDAGSPPATWCAGRRCATTASSWWTTAIASPATSNSARKNSDASSRR